MPRVHGERPKAAEARRDTSRAAPQSSSSRSSPAGRRGTLLSAAPGLGPGRPLDPAIRREMERSFGRDFGGIRIHDDSRADRSARSLGALAYSAGDDLVFAQGQYAPHSAAGRALIAHELAHSVQQAGVAMKADGPLPVGASRGLEAEADRAALAVGSGRRVPALSRGTTPAILRATAGMPKAEPEIQHDVAGVGKVTIETESASEPGGKITYLAATVSELSVPHKGPGPWVAAVYNSAATGGSLVYAANKTGDKFETITDPVANYSKKWLSRCGFKSLKDIAAALEKDEALPTGGKAILAGLEADDYVLAKCDIDHIVEKQLQGSNIQENLQLLSASTNRSAGARLAPRLAQIANEILAVRPGLEKIRLRFASVKLEDSSVADDQLVASRYIEEKLRAGSLAGQIPPAPAAGQVVIDLNAGGKGTVAFVKAGAPSKIAAPGNLLITGMRLNHYTRAADGKDKVSAKVVPVGLTEDEKAKEVVLKSVVLATKPDRAEATPATSVAPSEYRKLELPSEAVSLKAEYPYLSPATIKTLALKDEGASGTGVITPSVVKFLGPIDFAFAPGVLKATKNITPEQLKTPAKKFFRFTKGDLALELAPKFVPSGTLEFTIGPEANPVIAGSIVAAYKDGAFVATGDLWPARPIPGISKASGKVEYHSQKGWSGKLSAESSSIPLSTTTAEFSFAEQNGDLKAKGSGAIVTSLKGKELSLALDWAGGEVAYSGKVAIADPLPLIKTVTLDGRYAKGILRMSGNADIAWNQFKGSMRVVYVRKDGDEEGKFSGEATVKHDTEKSSVKVALKYNEAGKLSGSGTGAYQVTKDIRPELGIVISQDGRIKATGEVKLKDISFGKAWPAPPDNSKTIVQGGLKFRFPTPLLVVNGFGEVTGSLGVRFGVGPVMLKGVLFKGELFPLEKDPKIKAQLRGALVVPAFGEIYGTVGAFLGVEVLGGAVGLKGGIEVRPALRVQGEAGLAVDAAFASGAFSFSAEAYAKGQMYATLAVNLKAEVSAGYGFWSHEWIYKLASFSKKLGPELKVTIGKIAYSPQGGMTWPSLSQIKLEPATLDAMTIVKDLMKDAKDKEGTKEPKPK